MSVEQLAKELGQAIKGKDTTGRPTAPPPVVVHCGTITATGPVTVDIGPGDDVIVTVLDGVTATVGKSCFVLQSGAAVFILVGTHS